MKKVFLTITLIAGIVAGTMTLSAFTKSEPKNYSNTIVATDAEVTDNCSFEVTNVSPSINGTTVTITVTVRPTFSPSKGARYVVVVKPKGSLKNILDSQSKSVEFESKSSGGWYSSSGTVEFYCSVNDNSYNQCNSNDFYVSSCFEK